MGHEFDRRKRSSRRSCTTASCSCGTSARPFRRSTPEPATCSGSTPTSCPKTTRRCAASSGRSGRSPSAITSSSCRRSTCASWRWTSRLAKRSGMSSPTTTRACARTTAARSSSRTRSSSAPAAARRDTRIPRVGPTEECSRRADASSPATISKRESSCGGSTRSRRRTSLAATPGTTCRTRSAAAAPSGWSDRYDPELNLTYSGTGSPSPWSTVTRGTFERRGLYMNSTLAINPDTGKLVWYYQHIGRTPTTRTMPSSGSSCP